MRLEARLQNVCKVCGKRSEEWRNVWGKLLTDTVIGGVTKYLQLPLHGNGKR